MNYTNVLHKDFTYKTIALITIASLLIWALGLPAWINNTHAAQIATASDVLSDSDVSVVANHTIQFDTPTGVAADATIILTFSAGFNMGSVAFGDIDLADDTVDVVLAATPDTTDWGAAVSGQVLTFTNGSAAVVADSTIEIQIGTNADSGSNQITNDGTAGVETVAITGTFGDTGTMSVFIIDDVVVTATVDTSFTFAIAAVSSGATGANGESGTTTITTTSTTIPWATLVDDTAKTANHDLTVTTNAANGFKVTLHQDQNLTSGSNDIDVFKDGSDGSPAAWAAPTGTLSDENTFGHFGVTSDDADLSGGDDFGATLYDAIGVEATPLEVMYHSGPVNATGQGAVIIGYKIEISELQEASQGTAYTNALTYVATPVF